MAHISSSHGKIPLVCWSPNAWKIRNAQASRLPGFQAGLKILGFDVYFMDILSGWWFQPSWKILVSWEYYSQYMEKNMFQTTNQMDILWSLMGFNWYFLGSCSDLCPLASEASKSILRWLLSDDSAGWTPESSCTIARIRPLLSITAVMS